MNIPIRFVATCTVNYADTWRDPDEVVIHKIGEFKTLDDAMAELKEIYKHSNMTEFSYRKESDVYVAQCCCSYGATITIIPKYN